VCVRKWVRPWSHKCFYLGLVSVTKAQHRVLPQICLIDLLGGPLKLGLVVNWCGGGPTKAQGASAIEQNWSGPTRAQQALARPQILPDRIWAEISQPHKIIFVQTQPDIHLAVF
jgi:hypothetical protein